MGTRLPSADAISGRHRALRSAYAEHRKPAEPAAVIALTTELLDAGAAELAWQLLQPYAERAGVSNVAPSPQVALAWANALYETHRWKELAEYALQPAGTIQLPRPTEARILIRAAWAAQLSGNPKLADSFTERARGLVSQQESLGATADLRFLDAYYLAHRDRRPAEAQVQLDIAIGLYRELGESRYLTRALMLRSFLFLRMGLGDAGHHNVTEALNVAAGQSNPVETAGALMLLAVLHYRHGELLESARCADCAMAIVAQFPGLLRTGQLGLLQARIALFSDDTDAAQARLQSVEAGLVDHPSAIHAALLHEYRAIAALQRNEVDRALAELRIAQACLDDSGDHSYYGAEIRIWVAEALLAAGQAQEALEECIEAGRMLEASGEVLDKGHLLRVEALAKLALGESGLAHDCIGGSERVLRKLGDRYELALTLLTRCESFSSSPEAAVATAAEALTLLEQMGLTRRADRARELLALAQIRLRAQSSRQIDPASGSTMDSTNDGTALTASIPASALVDGIIAASPAMRALLKQAKTFAPHPSALLLTGETGVGKEVVARFIHRHSKRQRGEFVPINCGAVPETLFEREFFGHVKGAFTGADADRPGLVEYADGGTLFLDEIGELPLPMQVKLLRLVQEGTYRRVGDVAERRVDLRIVAATNRNLDDQVRARTFREDLLYRLRTFEMEIPPLRTRPEDVTPLVHYFLERESDRLRNELWMTGDSWALLKRYAWPGNVRELESALICAAAQAGRDGCIHAEYLPRAVRGSADLPAAAPLDLAEHLLTEERRLILKALERTKRSRAEAARALGISRNTLYDKMKRLGIDEKDASAE